MFPIYIPSKGRCGESTTAELLSKAGIHYWMVVEPHEYVNYRHMYFAHRVMKLPKDNQGLAYSRQFCKDDSTKAGAKYHWQLDDDIRSFLLRKQGGHEVLSSHDALSQIEAEVLRYKNIGQAGMNQNSWPPNYDRPIAINNLPVQAFLVNNSVKARFRLPILNDMDFTMQVLNEGFCTLLFDTLRTNCPPIGTNAGGLNDVYKKQEVILKSMQQIVKDNPSMSIDKDEKGWHLKKNRIWSTFKQRPILIKEEPFQLR